MVRKSLNVAHAKDLNGATICLLTGTTLETNIADYNRANSIKIKTLLFDKPEEAFAAADAGRCDGYTDDGGSVAAARSTMKKPDDWMFIPETIGGLQPLGPFTRLGDQGWSRLVHWVQNAMVEGELLGVTKANVDQIKASTKDPEMRRYLGLEGDFGKLLGVDNDWAYRIAKDIGNYGEVYDAYFGEKGLGLPRGMNNLYTKGGLFLTGRAGNDRLTWSGDRHRRARAAQWVLLGVVVAVVWFLDSSPPRPRSGGTDFGLRLPRRPDELRYPVSPDPLGHRRHLRARPAGVRAQHAAGLGDEHRRGHAAGPAGRHHAAVDQLAGAQHRAGVYRAGA